MFGYTDYAKLQEIERVFGIKRVVELERKGITGKFDVKHLLSIHKYIFQDVFPWAGELRVVNISKGTSSFGPARFLAGALTDALDKLRVESSLKDLVPSVFAERAAFYLGELNAIHPFREGNGRTQREFIRQLALNAGHPLSWAGFTQQRMVDASILSHLQGDNSALAGILLEALRSTREGAGT